MKSFHNLIQELTQGLETLSDLWAESRKPKLPLYLFLALCLNGLIVPIAYAATGSDLSRAQAWSLGLLGLTVFSLSLYMFAVMFAPEKF